MMQASLNCLIYGLLGLLPIIGPPFAVMAGFYSGRARSLEKQHWNPAHSIRLTGIGCAVAGVLIWSMVDILIIWHIYNYGLGGNSGD